MKLKVKEVAAGQEVQIAHAEVLQHPPYGKDDGSLYYVNLQEADQLDRYLSNGSEDIYKPTFTYHGFRYVAVINYPRDVVPSDLEKIRVNTNLKPNSNFHTSTALFNSIHQNVILGQLSNLMSIPTDCDQRNERLGWMGDAGLSSDSMALNFHMEAFFPHRVMQMRDEQMNGSVPDVVPFYKGGRRPADPSWGAAYPQTVWVLMKQYGDMNTARKYYHGLLEYIEFMETLVPSEGIGGLQGRYGDWVPPPEFHKVNNNLPSAFSLMLSIKQVAEIANALGDHDNTTRLSNLFKKHAEEFNKAFYSNGIYSEDVQTSYVLPLYLDIVPSADKEKVSSYLIGKLISHDHFHITSGIIGTKYILPVLTSLNRNDVATYTVNLVDYPSWGFMIHNPYEPATTIWELWNSHNGSATMDSRNHHMFSSVSGWMQTDMIGLTQPDGSYGYKVLDLFPASSLDLSAASMELDYPRPVKFSWHRKGGLQCGKAAEDRSSLNPGLPKHEGLKVSCGEGFISEVQFASYGNPTGVCGYHRHGNCHAPMSNKIVEKLCLNKTDCVISTSGDFWGDPCPGEVEVKWLTTAVVCKMANSNTLDYRYSSLQVNISVPVGSHAHLHIPAYGLSNLQLWDNEQLLYTNQTLQHEKGVELANWIIKRDILKLHLISGDYSITARGHPPEEIQTTVAANISHAHLSCLNNRTISSIDWVSYGNPNIGSHGNHSLGTCHSGASRMVVENACIGKNTCEVSMAEESFGGNPCSNIRIPKNGWSLIVNYSCNTRMTY